MNSSKMKPTGQANFTVHVHVHNYVPPDTQLHPWVLRLIGNFTWFSTLNEFETKLTWHAEVQYEVRGT